MSIEWATAIKVESPVVDDSLAYYEGYGIKHEKQQDLWSYNGQTSVHSMMKDIKFTFVPKILACHGLMNNNEHSF